MKRIGVLIVDDSAVVRQTLQKILEQDPQIEVIGTAVDPIIAAEKMRERVPDVITLDIEMPRMDGLTFLKRLMSQHPLPVVICSSLAQEGCESTLRALEYGAVDIIAKPAMGQKLFLEESAIRLCDAVKGAAAAVVHRVGPAAVRAREKKARGKPARRPVAARSMAKTTDRVVVLGASTGGTEAIRRVLEQYPVDGPGIAIVQHMPELFTAAFSKRLNDLCDITVKEAVDGDSVLTGQALIAPGNAHLLLKRSGARYYVDVRDGPLVSRHRPSVDVLFRSAARYGGANVLAVIMTGMGSDGAKGITEIAAAGGATIAQDEDTSVVFGMPNEAIKLGGIEHIKPLDGIVPEILRICRAD